MKKPMSKAQTGELFRELGLAIRGKSPGWPGEEGVIWLSIEERNHYCDRGHYLVKIHTGSNLLCLDKKDLRPNYYMSLSTAKEETIKWLKWRIRQERAEPYGDIRLRQSNGLPTQTEYDPE